ncbi:hypothetical protein BDZ45DRAFT_739476 [Acephala macrosclerotiorum]|nr:hypothetical protein BDZ45DRAFT_739476 [Acephala macrosclerotiorum]
MILDSVVHICVVGAVKRILLPAPPITSPHICQRSHDLEYGYFIIGIYPCVLAIFGVTLLLDIMIVEARLLRAGEELPTVPSFESHGGLGKCYWKSECHDFVQKVFVSQVMEFTG